VFTAYRRPRVLSIVHHLDEIGKRADTRSFVDSMMGTAARTTDSLAYSAGYDGMVRHMKMSFRKPALEGDVTHMDGTATAKQESASGELASPR
jgi:hypothetical protein